MRFEWDAENVEHIAVHGVLPEEVEEALADRHAYHLPAVTVNRERRWTIVGSTEDRRILFVVYTQRGPAIRVVHARDASPAHRRRYRRK